MSAIEEIASERQRQIEGEGWSVEHDDGHGSGEMARAASCYALAGSHDRPQYPGYIAEALRACWPWAAEWWKPPNPRRDLIKAGALIVAEIERLDRTLGDRHDD